MIGLRNLVCLTALIAAAPVEAQNSSDTTRPTNGRRFKLDGDLGSDAELYRITGREPRRPGESARIFFNPTLAFGSLKVTGNFLISTEGSSTLGLGGLPGRQRINQFGLTPDWGWGKAYLGSFSNTYTPLTWTGVRVDGAGLDLKAGDLRAGFFAGSSREPVFGGATSGSFSRAMMGARVGLGARPEFGSGGRFIELVLLRAKDDPSSLPPLADSTPVPYLPDSIAVEPDTTLLPRVPINPYAVTPQENAVVSTSAGMSLFGGALAFTGELAGSIHTRDQRASRLTDDVLGEYPGFLRGLVTPRAGTHADYAVQSQLDIKTRLPGSSTRSPRYLTATVTYQSIGAGYVSLGTGYLPNDLRGFEARTAFRFRHWSLQLDGLEQRDNLLGQKLGTTYRSRVGAALMLQPVRGWHSTVRVSSVGMNRDLADSAGGVDYSAYTLGTSQTWIPLRKMLIRSVTASYTYQDIGDANPLRLGSSFKSHGTDVRATFAVAPNATISPTAGIIRSTVGAEDPSTRATYGIAGDWRDAKRRWSSAASVSRSQVSRTSALTTRLSVRFPLTAADAVTLIVRTSRYRSLVKTGLDFDEQVVSLRWSRQL